jgi:hypothetical protein
VVVGKVSSKCGQGSGATNVLEGGFGMWCERVGTGIILHAEGGEGGVKDSEGAPRGTLLEAARGSEGLWGTWGRLGGCHG